jgi:HSP20 family protein
MTAWKKRERKRELGDYSEEDFFRDLDDELDNIELMFNELKKRLLENRLDDGPHVYGFSVKFDPEGRPMIEDFGNMNEFLTEQIELPDEKEFLTDVIDGDKELTVMAELPGASKEDIDIRIEERILKIMAATKEGLYSKGVKLPCKVKAETAKAAYNNGVLELKLERMEARKKSRGYKVKVK